jgi:hypothetical protein
MDLLPNFANATLICGTVRFDDEPPCTAHFTLAEYPIIAFQQDGKRFIPVTIAGPITFWGELRVSTVGAFIAGVTGGAGVELPDGTRCESRAAFEQYAIAVVGRLVRDLRQEKGWPAERLPAVDQDGGS